MSASVEHLAIVWSSIDQLCSGLPAGRWDLPTGCPGWTVKDHLSHLVDYEARALGRPAPEHEPGQLPHVKNEMGQANEIGLDVRRPRPGAQVLTEFRQVTGKRLARLRTLTGQDPAPPAGAPARSCPFAGTHTLGQSRHRH